MASITLYQNAEYGGRELTLESHSERLHLQDFNDRTSSLKVESGIWILYQDSSYQGDSYIVYPGQEIPHMSAVFCDNCVSSLRPLPEDNAITLFEDSNYGGQAYTATESEAHLSEYGMNDSTSSIFCSGGDWTVWQNAGYGGDSFQISGRNSYAHSDSWDKTFGNDSISSVSKH